MLFGFLKIVFMKYFFASCLLLLPCGIFCQVQDDFSDGDFTNNPTWSGNNLLWVVENGQLRSNSLSANTYFLSTPSTLATEVSWEFFVNLQFSTSGANFTDVYLISDNSDLTQTMAGYFIRIGDTQDEIVLYRQDVSSIFPLIDNAEGIVNSSSNNPFRIRVTRDTNDLWTLFIDDGDTGNFVDIGSVIDGTFNSSSFFGVKVEQSPAAGPVQSHFFDDFIVEAIVPDIEPPSITALSVINQNELQIQFSEAIDTISATNMNNYSVNNGIGNPSSISLITNNQVSLLFNISFIDLLPNNLNVAGVEDLSGNAISDTTVIFTFLAPFQPNFRDIVINEIQANPNGVVGLPEVEYLELFNRSNRGIGLEGWRVEGVTPANQSLESFILQPQSLLVLVDDNDVDLFADSVDVIAWGTSGSLTNAGETLVLFDNSGIVIDSITFNNVQAGVSLEQINPFTDCNDLNNFASSIDLLGGTPGFQNSVFDDTPDTTPPEVVQVSVLDSLNLIIEFSERMDDISLVQSENYDFPGSGIMVEDISITDNNFSEIVLVLNSNIPQGRNRQYLFRWIIGLPGQCLIGYYNKLWHWQAT